jgi:hypothetical protein
MGLGSIVSGITSAVTDPGKLVSEVANSILPSNMKGVGDVLGGIADLNTGHPLQALGHLNDALKDLPQLLQSLSGGSGGAAHAASPAGTPGAEPSAPPTRATTCSPTATASGPTATATATSASATPAPAASSASTPSSSSASAPVPSVTVRKFGNETITQVDDGKNTTTINQAGSQTRVSVRSDTPPASAPGASASTATTVSGSSAPAPAASSTGTSSPGSPSISANAQAAGVTVRNFGNETVTRVDDGQNTTTIDQKGRQTTVSVRSDSQSGRGWHPSPAPGGSAATASLSAPTSGAPAAPSSASTASGTTSASSANAASGSGSVASSNAVTSSASGSNSTGTSTATGAANSSSTTSGPSGTASKDLASLMALSPDQFMQAVTSGKIPADVANDQSAMMQVQARMNQITQMNQLVTSMMAAMHQMQMSIIQNIRC